MEAGSTTSDESGTRPPETLMQNSVPMERSASTTTATFRENYDTLLKEVLEENSEDDSAEELLSNIDIDVNTATADLPDELRAALEDHALADKYLANLKNFMSHQRTHSYGSMTSGKGDYSSPNTPLQSTFPHHQTMSPKPLLRIQYDPLSKVLDAIPYNTRLVNGVQSLTVLEQKFHASRIPELDLPTISDTIIRSRLDDLYKIQDELYIHLHGGPLVRNANMAHNIGEKKKHKILNLLDEIGKEIGLYEEFVKRAHYLSLDSILNESDNSSGDEYFHEDDETNGTSPSMNHFDTPSNMSRATPGTPHSSAHMSPYSASSKKARRVTSYSTLSTSSLEQPRSSPGTPMRPRLDSPLDSSRHSSEMGTISDRSPSMSLLLAEDSSVQLNESGKDNVEPWEAFKWTPLKKISDQLYAEDVKKQSGLASVLAVSGVIAIGTTRSLVFVYDYSQNLKCILGDSARAVELGAVTSLAISADHTTIACGHSQGYIVVWDITKPAHPTRVIDPIPANFAPGNLAAASASQQQQASRKEGHVKGAAILHIGFVGVKKSEIVSGDDQGMAFYHVLYKVVMVNAVDTTRILGRYQNLSFTTLETASDLQRRLSMAERGSPLPPKPRRPSTVFAMQPLPLGQLAHPAESFGLVALLTPYKMIIVGLKPTPQTQYKFLKPKPFTPAVGVNGVFDETAENATQQQQQQQQQEHQDEEVVSKPAESLAGCLAWLPVTKSGSAKDISDKGSKNVVPPTDPLLAFSWGQHLFILQVTVESVDKANGSARPTRGPLGGKRKRGNKLNFVKYGEYKCKDVIVGLQWINRQILVMLTPNEEMILFDPKNMVETERASLRTKELVYHDRFNAPLHDMLEDTPQQGIERSVPAPNTIEMAYYHSLRGYKGKLFLLGLNKLYIGNLLSWADRIIALVRSGDFLEGIELATLFYNGKFTQTVVGLPEDEQARKQLVGEKLMELLVASLNFAFASTRAFETFDDDAAGSGTVLFHDLASGCIKACLSMNNLEFLFDTVYDRFCEANVPGAFLQVLEPYILQERVSDVPPALMKDLVDYYCSKRWISRLEQIIWHVNPQCLDIDQIVSMCHREGMYEAMMYVWNRNMNDYVSPLVEMLKVIRSVLKQENTGFGVSSHSFYQRGKTRMASIESGKALEYPDETPVAEEDAAESDQRQNAEKLFDYLKMIWTGRTYPDGLPMSSSKANEARSAVYTFVFSGRCVVWPRVGGKLVLTADDEEPTYPYLRLLLRFNTRKFLNALETAFEDPWLNGGEDIMTSTMEEETQGKVISRQIIINTLLDVMGGGQSGNALPVPPPRPKQSFSTSTVQSIKSSPTNTTTDSDSEGLIQLYMFIATNLHKYTTFILLPPTILHKILVRLAEENNASTRQERQLAVQNLLTVYTPVNEEEMILYYEDAGFWQVLEEVYQRDRKYGKLVEAYLKDDERRDMVFDCVYRLLDSRSELNEMKRNEVKNVFMIRISQFVELDGQKSAQVVEKFFDGKHEEAIRRLEEDREFDDDDSHEIADKHVFLYLRGLLEPYAMQQGEESGNGPRSESYETGTGISTNIDAHIQERYIELMCRFDPSGVYNYLNTKLDSQVNLKTVQESCEKHGVMDAVVWIMEKSGNAQGALDTMLSVAKEKNTIILEIIRAHRTATADGQDPQPIWTFEEQGMISSCLIGLSGVLRVGTRLCENSSRTASDEDGSEIESLWFRLLDAYVESSIEVYNALGAAKIPQGLYQHIQSSFKSFVQSILTSLLLSTSPQVSLPRLLLRLIESQARGETTFADFRDIFKSMLDTYKYEGKLLEMTNKLFDRDLYRGVQEMVRDKGRGWRPRRGLCDICGGTILDLTLLQKPLAWDDADDEQDKQKKEEDEPKVKDVVVFQCGHVYHRQCLELQQQNEPTTCVICHRGGEKAPKQEPKKEAKGKERA